MKPLHTQLVGQASDSTGKGKSKAPPFNFDVPNGSLLGPDTSPPQITDCDLDRLNAEHRNYYNILF